MCSLSIDVLGGFMKKIFLFTIAILLSVFYFVNEFSAKFFISLSIPRISVPCKKNSKYMALLDKGNLSNDIFKKTIKIEEEKIVEDFAEEVPEENEIVIGSNCYEVTLDWSNMLKNLTTYKVDVEKLLEEDLKFKLSKNDIETVIYHTHTTESYTQSENYTYEASGVYRTLNNNANMIRIGGELKKNLQKNGVAVFHDKTIYDYPDYNSSYSKAGKGIDNILEKYKNAKIVLDLHRDAISINTDQYKPIVQINDKKVAQFLIVIGTNQGGLKHSEWRENLKLALKIKKLADEKYPGLCRNVILRKERFNQHVANGAMIVEMGATGNTVEEVLETTKYFSELLVEICK